MTFLRFRELIHQELRQHPDGLSWVELRERLHLPYERPCPAWVRQLEQQISLRRVRGTGRAKVWTVG